MESLREQCAAYGNKLEFAKQLALRSAATHEERERLRQTYRDEQEAIDREKVLKEYTEKGNQFLAARRKVLKALLEEEEKKKRHRHKHKHKKKKNKKNHAEVICEAWLVHRLTPFFAFHKSEATEPRWTFLGHFGRCGQNCGCCRANHNEVFGTCEVCADMWILMAVCRSWMKGFRQYDGTVVRRAPRENKHKTEPVLREYREAFLHMAKPKSWRACRKEEEKKKNRHHQKRKQKKKKKKKKMNKRGGGGVFDDEAVYDDVLDVRFAKPKYCSQPAPPPSRASRGLQLCSPSTANSGEKPGGPPAYNDEGHWLLDGRGGVFDDETVYDDVLDVRVAKPKSWVGALR